MQYKVKSNSSGTVEITFFFFFFFRLCRESVPGQMYTIIIRIRYRREEYRFLKNVIDSIIHRYFAANVNVQQMLPGGRRYAIVKFNWTGIV